MSPRFIPKASTGEEAGLVSFLLQGFGWTDPSEREEAQLGLNPNFHPRAGKLRWTWAPTVEVQCSSGSSMDRALRREWLTYRSQRREKRLCRRVRGRKSWDLGVHRNFHIDNDTRVGLQTHHCNLSAYHRLPMPVSQVCLCLSLTRTLATVLRAPLKFQMISSWDPWLNYICKDIKKKKRSHL